MRRLLRKGDPCPCCGNPIPTDDEATLGLLTVLAERMGLPVPPAALSEETSNVRS